MPVWILMALFSIFFLVSFRILLRHDDLLAVFYASLFIYTIFTQIGYGAFPNFAKGAGWYFGRDIFYDYWLFISLSFGVIFGLLWVLVHIRSSNHPAFIMVWRPLPISSFILYGVGGVFILLMIYHLRSNQDSLTYVSITFSEGGQIFAFSSAVLVLLMLAYYAKFRRLAYSRGARALAFVFWGVSLFILIILAILTGDRSLIVSLFMALVAYELVPFEFAWRKVNKKLVVIGILGVLSLLMMQRIALIRGYGEPSLALFANPSIQSIVSTDAIESLVLQDYFAPSFPLIASMYYEYIDPGEVLRSNFYNTLVFQDYPYLSETVGRLLAPTTRKQGFAYYILTEGYNMAGWGGILYNGIVVVGLLAIWRRIKSSDNKNFNRFMSAVMISLVIPMVRGQSIYFLRNIYMTLLPAIFLYYLVSGWLPSLRKRAYVATSNQTLRESQS